MVEFIGGLASRRNADRVVCIGAPTVHEYVKNASTMKSVSSWLLDIDVRLVGDS